MLNYIPDDGYTVKAYLKELPNVHGPVRFSFRPMTYEERQKVLSANSGRSVAEASQLVPQVVKRYVTSWDIKQASGSLYELTLENVRRLAPAVLERMYHCIGGWEGGDPDSDATPAEAEAKAELDLEALLSGRTVGLVREEADAKNSSAD